MALTLDSLALPDDLLWTDEFDWTPTEQHQTRTLAGALVFEQALRQGGRPITLSGGSSHGWATRSQIDLLYAKLTIDAPLALVLPDTRCFVVRFRHEDKPIDAKPIVDYRVIETGDYYSLSVKLITTNGNSNTGNDNGNLPTQPNSYVFVQPTPAQTWTVIHNLGYYPIVEVFNSAGYKILVTPLHINSNRFDLTFNEPVSGHVIYK